jgi:hypothetical protein
MGGQTLDFRHDPNEKRDYVPLPIDFSTGPQQQTGPVQTRPKTNWRIGTAPPHGLSVPCPPDVAIVNAIRARIAHRGQGDDSPQIAGYPLIRPRGETWEIHFS